MDVDFDAPGWAELLTRELRRPVRVTFGRARRDVLVARPEGNGLHVRLNAMFAGAPPDVREAVVRWLRSGRRARRAATTLDDWIARALGTLPPPAPRAGHLHPRGEHHDLEALAAALYTDSPGSRAAPDLIGADLLPEARRPALTWGRRRRTGARRSLHLGSYDADRHLIRVHPVLDQAAVPAWYVRCVLFHELLHAAFPPRRENGRTVIHGPELRRRERAYRDYGRGREWEQKNLNRLLRSARVGSTLRVRREPRELLRAVQGLLFRSKP